MRLSEREILQHFIWYSMAHSELQQRSRGRLCDRCCQSRPIPHAPSLIKQWKNLDRQSTKLPWDTSRKMTMKIACNYYSIMAHLRQWSRDASRYRLLARLSGYCPFTIGPWFNHRRSVDWAVENAMDRGNHELAQFIRDSASNPKSNLRVKNNEFKNISLPRTESPLPIPEGPIQSFRPELVESCIFWTTPRDKENSRLVCRSWNAITLKESKYPPPSRIERFIRLLIENLQENHPTKALNSQKLRRC